MTKLLFWLNWALKIAQSATRHQEEGAREESMRLSKRRMITGAGALMLSAAARSAYADWQPSERYPDPSVRALDPAFNKYMVFFAAVERLYFGDTRYAEGPVWFGDGRYLLWTDIPNNRILKWEE